VRRIGIYRTAFPLASEPFIVEQASALRRYEPLMLTRSRCGTAPVATRALSDGPFAAARTAAFALTRSTRLFGRLPDLGLVHAHFGPDGVYAESIARHLRVPYLVTFHGFDATMTRAALWRSRKGYAMQFLLRERQLCATASAFIAVSKFIAACLRARGYPSDKIIQHYIGVDTDRFQVDPRDRLDDGYVLSVGRAVEKKGLDTVIRAFARIAARHPRVRLVHVGGGPLLARLRQLAHALGISGAVEFRGPQPHHEVTTLMRGAAVFALASRTGSDGDAEGLGIVFNEASACGVPIVATRHGGVPEAVLHGETGLLSAEHDEIAMAEHLDAVLADRALADRLGTRGRELVCEVFDLRKQTARLEEVYDQYAS
jgi:glycosyltransferase involved in cell wall biosynthesis